VGRINLAMSLTRFAPSKDTLKVLNGRPWVTNFSGGKDSTALASWVECLRRLGLVAPAVTPRLVMSDTTVKFPFLSNVAGRFMAALAACGWRCEVVTPRTHEKLYNRIFGIGNVPVHPGSRKRMRWCTRATKIDPMRRFAKTLGEGVVQLSGVRWGESETRDGKLRATGCAAGGECGLPEPGRDVYGPLIAWKTYKVFEWLRGDWPGAEEVLPDLLPLTRELLAVYEVNDAPEGLYGIPPKATALRFGCVGCPAISNEKVTRTKQAKEHPGYAHLKRLYGVWQQLYLRKNRCCRVRDEPSRRAEPKAGAKPAWYSMRVGFGPVRMEVRKRYFAELLDIQRQSGVTLVTAEDEAFIRDCWARKVYPRGWSEADESVVPPEEGLFAGVE
jgi:3'-phosphoadenosine 5'-phosphosulfate sulfotransferase (PAPS reductase)/FAD synthetase